MQHILDTQIVYLKGVGPKRAEMLQKELSIFNYSDLLTFYPFRYIDRSKFYKVNEVKADLAYLQIKGRIINLKLQGERKSARLTATLVDETGELDLIWFQGIKWVKDKIKSGQEYILFGKPSIFNRRINIVHPEIDIEDEESQGIANKLQPVYSSSEKLSVRGLTAKGLAKLTKTLLTQVSGSINETLSEEILKEIKLISRESALINIHYPESFDLLKKAQARLKFEELFFIQLQLLRLKIIRTEKTRGNRFEKVGEIFNRFYQHNLPFQLTEAQKRVIREIRKDLGSGHQMNRLLQGDVGSGKTLVALMTMLIGIDNGFQACLMAPTEILANQHYITISRFLAGLNININLLTGSTKTSARKKIFEELSDGSLNILVGTHALIEVNVTFKNLGIVVIDEQHRFGVEQRAKMWAKNQIPPHILVMTATPIPRTLAMTLYGDLDVSVIDELPPGRKSVKTLHFFDSKRARVFGFMREQINLGRQIYIVYPLINESETLDLKDLNDGYESIAREFPLPHYAVSIVHGQMKADAKDYEMQRFVKGETNIMVSTTVIEVGVDVPNASVMIIENAERFGLSQLHQLRGRVGRGADQSYCILMSKYEMTSEAKIRLETMVNTNDGFEISEVDLKIRGPGDIQGTQQSGIMDLKIADIVKDEKIIKYARSKANEILKEDPELKLEKNFRLKKTLELQIKKNQNWGMIS